MKYGLALGGLLLLTGGLARAAMLPYSCASSGNDGHLYGDLIELRLDDTLREDGSRGISLRSDRLGEISGRSAAVPSGELTDAPRRFFGFETRLSLVVPASLMSSRPPHQALIRLASDEHAEEKAYYHCRSLSP